MDSRKTPQSRPWLAVGQEIDALLEQIAPEEFAALVRFLDGHAERLFFSGQGRSGLAGKMAAMRFMHLGYDVHFVGEATAPSVRRNDRLVMISGSGATRTSVGFATTAKNEGVRVALLTRTVGGPIADLAEVVLRAPANGSQQFGGSLFEQSCVILLDAVALDIARRTPDAHAIMARRHTNLE